MRVKKEEIKAVISTEQERIFDFTYDGLKMQPDKDLNFTPIITSTNFSEFCARLFNNKKWS